jgi:hypothetical protein
VIAVHDWEVEIGPEDTRRIETRLKLNPFMPERWNKMNVQMAIWQKGEK